MKSSLLTLTCVIASVLPTIHDSCRASAEKSTTEGLALSSSSSTHQSSGITVPGALVSNDQKSDTASPDSRNLTHEMSDTILSGDQNLTHEMSDTILSGDQNLTHGMSDTGLRGGRNLTHGMSDTILSGDQNLTHEMSNTILSGDQNLTHEMSDTILSGDQNLTHGMSDTGLRGGRNLTQGPARSAPVTMNRPGNPTADDDQFLKQAGRTPYIMFPTITLTSTYPFGPTLPPWYLNSISSLEETQNEKNLTKLDLPTVEEMLREIEKSIEFGGTRYATVVINEYELSIPPELTWLFPQQSLCGQAEVILRMSCRGRCGQTPETRNIPAQCACDHNCFLLGDCCEDINLVCAQDFLVAATKMYSARENFTRYAYASCLPPYWPLVFSELSTLALSSPPREVTVYCQKGFFQDALINLLDALDDFMCMLEDTTHLGNELTYNRLCGRPEVLVCEPSGSSNSYRLYPVHLYCFEHPLTGKLITRYHRGLATMELVARNGTCSHLREAWDSREALLEGISDSQALEQYIFVKLVTVAVDGDTFFDFQNNEIGSMRCWGEPAKAQWACSLQDCFEKRVLDKDSNTCYYPDHVSVQVLAGTDGLVDSVNGDDASFKVSSCLCLNLQVILSVALDESFLADNSALQGGRCTLSVYDRTSFRSLNDEVNQSFPSNQTANSRTGNSREGSTTSDDGPGERDLSTFTFFSTRVLELWSSRGIQCSEEDFTAVRVCFSTAESPNPNSTCFLLLKSEPQPLREAIGEGSDTRANTAMGSASVGHMIWLLLTVAWRSRCDFY